MERIATISSKGQITLPADFRRKLNIREGDRVSVVKRGDHIEIKPDTYEQELAELRRQVHAQLQKNGLSNLSWKEVRRRADEARAAEYRGKQ